MKKVLAMIITVLMILTIAVSAEGISVILDDKIMEFDAQPQKINDRVMVPMRFIFETLGATVMWDEETETISAFRSAENGESTIIILQINNANAFVNTETIELDSPPVLVDGRTLVPVRFVSEALGCDVDWDGDKGIVYITSKTEEEQDKEENDGFVMEKDVTNDGVPNADSDSVNTKIEGEYEPEEEYDEFEYDEMGEIYED